MTTPPNSPADVPIVRMTPPEYRDRVLGGWLGKNAGSTLGTPFEGRTEPLGLTFYEPVPVQPAANDDLDLELLWLHALEAHGIGLTSLELASEWLEHMRYPWDEYGFATFNLRRGLNPPLSGRFANWFKDSMGATIRSEIWAMIAPGAPDVAVAFAYSDAVVDHADEGVWALLFLTAMESAAFFVNYMDKLLQIGLARIPATSRIARAVQMARTSHSEGKSALETRAAILQAVGRSNVTDVAQNLGFIALGLLYGNGDFGATLCSAVNCGYDTDTTGATVGAILGIRSGASALPKRWLDPIGERVVVGWGVEGLQAPTTVQELTDRTVAIGMQVVANRCPGVTFDQPDTAAASGTTAAEGTDTAPSEAPAERQQVPLAVIAAEPNWLDASASSEILSRPSTVSIYRLGDLELTLDFGSEGPAVVPDRARSFIIRLRNVGAAPFAGKAEVETEQGWQVAVPGAQGPAVKMEPGQIARLGYVVKPPSDVSEGNQAVRLRVTDEAGRAEFLAIPFVPTGCWWCVGPLKNEYGGGFEHGYPVELKPDVSERYLGRGDGLVGWQRMAFAETVIEVEPIFSGMPGVAYAMTVLRCKSPQDVRLVVHTNDGVRVWLNDRLVYQVHDHSLFRPTLCSGPNATVRLRAGENRLLVKIVRCDEPAHLALSLLDTGGQPVDRWGNHRW